MGCIGALSEEWRPGAAAAAWIVVVGCSQVSGGTQVLRDQVRGRIAYLQFTGYRSLLLMDPCRFTDAVAGESLAR